MDIAIRSSISRLPNAHISLPVEVRVPARLRTTNWEHTEALQHSARNDGVSRIKCVDSSDFAAKTMEVEMDNGSADGSGGRGSGGDGKFSSGGGVGGGGGGDDSEESDYEEEEFGPVMRFEEVMRETEKRGTSLPSDMIEAAKTIGLRSLVLSRYLDLQVDVYFAFVL